MKKVFQLFLVLVLALALVGCKKGGNEGGGSTELKTISVATAKSVARVQVGHTLQCTYKVSPAGAVVDNVKWSVSNSLGTISETGLFTAGPEPGLIKITIIKVDTYIENNIFCKRIIILLLFL